MHKVTDHFTYIITKKDVLMHFLDNSDWDTYNNFLLRTISSMDRCHNGPMNLLSKHQTPKPKMVLLLSETG